MQKFSRFEWRKNVLLLLSHHHPTMLHRTFRISFLGRTLYLCARCSGTVIGLVVGSIIFSPFIGQTTIPANVVFMIITLPALIDWATQYAGFRESTNYLRLFTGILLGIGLSTFQVSSEVAWSILLYFVIFTGVLFSFPKKTKSSSGETAIRMITILCLVLFALYLIIYLGTIGIILGGLILLIMCYGFSKKD